MIVAGRVRWVGFCVVPDERILRGWLCEPAEHGFFTESCQTEMRSESGSGPVRLVQELSSV